MKKLLLALCLVPCLVQAQQSREGERAATEARAQGCGNAHDAARHTVWVMAHTEVAGLVIACPCTPIAPPDPVYPSPFQTRCVAMERTRPPLTLMCHNGPYPNNHGCVIPLYVTNEIMARWRGHSNPPPLPPLPPR